MKPNGVLGEAYMLAIRPFRYAIVYPALMRQIEAAAQAAQQSTPLGRSTTGA